MPTTDPADSARLYRMCHKRIAGLGVAPVARRVIVEDGDYHRGPAGGGAELCLRTSRFETLRWRTGRPSRAQLAAMDWSGDPEPVLDASYLFGPATADIVE